jgi:hypothetical protein
LSALHGHELCTRSSWINPVARGNPFSQQQGHPTPAGQRAMARVVKAYLKAHPR